MKAIIPFIILFILLFTLKAEAGEAGTDNTTLSGKVTDKKTGETLPGVTIYFPDLKTGGVTNMKGIYKIEGLPKSKVLVQVRFIGYKTIIDKIDLAITTTKNFALEQSVTELNEVVITGLSQAAEISRTPAPIVTMSPIELKEMPSTNIIDAIAKQPGVSAVTTGPNVSKPYIRGLGYNRVLTLYDGVREEGQQWGDEHGIEVDEYAIDRIEVVKGPSSLTYGSDALAGVVNLLPAQPVPEGTISGEILSNYQTNNGLIGLSGAAFGNSKGFVWGGRVSHKMASDYQDPVDGRVYGTKFSETDANAYIGVNKGWGYSHLRVSVYDDLQEIPDGSRDSATRQFTKQISEIDTFRPIVSNDELTSYKIGTLHQHVQHYSFISTSSFIMGAGKLGVTLGYQESVRREFSHPLYPDLAGLDLVLPSYTYDVKYYFPETNGWESTAGVNGMYQTNTTRELSLLFPIIHCSTLVRFFLQKKQLIN